MKLLYLFILSRITDLGTTFMVLKRDGLELEGNPIVRELIRNHGFLGVVLFNVFATLIMFLILKRYGSSRLVMGSIKGIIIIFFAVSLSNLILYEI